MHVHHQITHLVCTHHYRLLFYRRHRLHHHCQRGRLKSP